ncbi:MAG: hypothetical protein N2689_05915 [Verrucomicrobiae bacterium]|nr:hypothetical protein [Verrucomicrobiae bacterium]
MNKALSLLVRLQEHIHQSGGTTIRRALSPAVLRLRAQIPQEYLCRFDRLTRQGRLAVAPVSESGACGACHLLLPAGDIWMLREMSSLLATCPHCGCYVYFKPRMEKAAKSRTAAARSLETEELSRLAAAVRHGRAARQWARA